MNDSKIEQIEIALRDLAAKHRQVCSAFSKSIDLLQAEVLKNKLETGE